MIDGIEPEELDIGYEPPCIDYEALYGEQETTEDDEKGTQCANTEVPF